MKKKLLIILLLGLISFSLTGCLPGILPDTNNPPVITPIPNATITVGETFTYPVEANDPDGDDLTYSLPGTTPTDMNINENSGVITWTPNYTGSFEVTVGASDGKSSDTESFTVTVSPALIGPSNIGLTPLTATVGVEYTGIATATPGDNTTLTFSLVGTPSDMEISTTGAITWTPTVTGDQTVTVVVTDGAGLSDSKDFTIIVSPANHRLVITPIPNANVTAGETFTYTVEATDPEGDDLAYSLTTDPSTDMTIDEDSGVITWIPITVGSFEVTVGVSDGKSSDTESFTVTVSPALSGPSDIGLTPLAATVGVEYIGTVTVTPGDNITLAFNLIGAPFGMEISAAGVITWIPTVTGDQTVTVVVTDGAELSDSKDFTIIVSPANHRPVITPITDATLTAGETFTYTVGATDPDGDDLTYSLTTNPSIDMSIDENSGAITWIPTAVGNFDVTIEVSDGELSDTQNFTIEVVSPQRVVMFELFEGAACSRCRAVHSDIVRLREEYNFDELLILEEYVIDSDYIGWATSDIKDRYSDYRSYTGSEYGGFPAAYFNGINQFVYYGDAGYNKYKAAIEAELTKPTKIAISASYNVTGKTVSISGNIINIGLDTLSNLVVEAMVYEDSVYSEYRGYNVDHVVRDIITYEEIGGEEQITSFAPGDSYEFSLTSSYLSNVHNMNNIHVVVYVQAPNSPTMEILQALYLE